MSTPLRVTFYADENLPVRFLVPLLGSLGHVVTPVQVKAQDPAILRTAEQHGAVVITADTWFLKELYRYPFGHPNGYSQAGVVQVPGAWGDAWPRLQLYAPLIHTVCDIRSQQADHRVGIDLSKGQIRVCHG